MKKINFIFVIMLSILIASCGAVEEKRSNKEIGENVKDKSNDAENNYPGNNETVNKLSNTDSIKSVTKQTEIDSTDIPDVEGDVKEDNSKGKETVMTENSDGSVSAVPNTDLKVKKSNHVKQFYVIAGSFKDVENAHVSRKFYRDKGYKAIVLVPYQGWYRVSTGAYANRELAEKAIAKVRNKVVWDSKNMKIKYWLLWR